jgi:hypothetical protein
MQNDLKNTLCVIKAVAVVAQDAGSQEEEGEGEVRVVHLGLSTYHATRGRCD